MTEPSVPADPRARRVALLAMVALAVVGAVLLWYCRRELKRLSARAGEDRAAAVAGVRRLVNLAAALGAAGFVGMGIWLWRLARRIRRADQYPPPDMKPIRQTRLRTGADAWKIAAQAELAALLALGGAAAVGYLWWVAGNSLR